MAQLVLSDHAEVRLYDLWAALSRRLSSKYDVHMSETAYTKAVVVRKTPWMAIAVAVRPVQNQTSFHLGYQPGSFLLMGLLFVLLIPALAMIPLSRSRSRYELEDEVIGAIKDSWPAARPYRLSRRRSHR